jgi:hypothetical protein
LVGRLPVIAPLDAMGVQDLARIILTQPKDSIIAKYRKLVRFHGADLVFTDAAVRKFTGIALARGTGARGLRSVIEEVLEGVLFDVEADVGYVVTEKTVRGGEAVRQRVEQSRAPLGERVLRRLACREDRIIPVIEITARQAGEQGTKKAQITKRPASPVISSGQSHLGAGCRAYQALLEGQVLRDPLPPRHLGRPLLSVACPGRTRRSRSPGRPLRGAGDPHPRRPVRTAAAAG